MYVRGETERGRKRERGREREREGGSKLVRVFVRRRHTHTQLPCSMFKTKQSSKKGGHKKKIMYACITSNYNNKLLCMKIQPHRLGADRASSVSI